MSTIPHSPPNGSAFCCYILQSERWPTPYTGKTCDLARRLHRHNHLSKRSRAYTKGKGPWRAAAAVFGLRSNRQSMWLELALKRHARHRARPAGLSAVQSAVFDAVRVSSHPGLWWRGGVDQPAPTLHVHVFKCATVGFLARGVAFLNYGDGSREYILPSSTRGFSGTAVELRNTRHGTRLIHARNDKYGLRRVCICTGEVLNSFYSLLRGVCKSF